MKLAKKPHEKRFGTHNKSIMYPLPPELSAKILAILDEGSGLESQLDIDSLHDQIAVLFVRENRRLRQQVAELWRNYSAVTDRHDVSDNAMIAAGGGEFTCDYIINEILKRNVYFNTKDAADRAEAVERLIESLNDD